MTTVDPGMGLELHEQPHSPLPMTVDEATEAMAHYQRISHALIDQAKDMQDIGKSKFPKRSAFQKLANAYRVSTKIVSDETDYDDEGRMIRARITVRATHPDGRYQDGDGRCHILEQGERKASDPKAEHDCHGTAVTRAKNRAIGDLIAFGAVSAEEAESTLGGGGPASSPNVPGWAAPMQDIPGVAHNIRRILQAAGHENVAARAMEIGEQMFQLCDGSFPFALARFAHLLADAAESPRMAAEPPQEVDEARHQRVREQAAASIADGTTEPEQVDGEAVETINEQEEEDA